MTTSQLHDLQCSYSLHLRSNYHRTNVPSLYHQASSPPGIIYVGRTPTMEHNQLYPNEPSNNLRMYEECILTTTRFLLVYDNDPNYDFFIFHTPGKQDHLTIDIHFQLSHLNGIHTEEVDLLKFKRTNDLPPWFPVFQIPYQIKAKVYHSVHCFDQVEIH